MTATESNAPSTPSFSLASSGCGAVADVSALSQSGSTGTFTVYARAFASASGCTLTVSDGSGSIDVAVSNTYSGVEGTPTVSYFTSGVSSAGSAMTVGPDGAMWFAEAASPSKLGTFTAGASPTVTEYDDAVIDASHPPQAGALAAGPDGKMWYAGYPAFVGNMATSGCSTACTAYAAASGENPNGIVAGPDGAMWFTEPVFSGTNSIGRMTTDGTLTSYSSGSPPDRFRRT